MFLSQIYSWHLVFISLMLLYKPKFKKYKMLLFLFLILFFHSFKLIEFIKDILLIFSKDMSDLSSNIYFYLIGFSIYYIFSSNICVCVIILFLNILKNKLIYVCKFQLPKCWKWEANSCEIDLLKEQPLREIFNTILWIIVLNVGFVKSPLSDLKILFYSSICIYWCDHILPFIFCSNGELHLILECWSNFEIW